MGKDQKNFRDRLIIMAQIVELFEDIFKTTKKITINIDLSEPDFNEISQNLNKNINDENIIISIGEVDFIFFRK